MVALPLRSETVRLSGEALRQAVIDEIRFLLRRLPVTVTPGAEPDILHIHGEFPGRKEARVMLGQIEVALHAQEPVPGMRIYFEFADLARGIRPDGTDRPGPLPAETPIALIVKYSIGRPA